MPLRLFYFISGQQCLEWRWTILNSRKTIREAWFLKYNMGSDQMNDAEVSKIIQEAWFLRYSSHSSGFGTSWTQVKLYQWQDFSDTTVVGVCLDKTNHLELSYMIPEVWQWFEWFDQDEPSWTHIKLSKRHVSSAVVCMGSAEINHPELK